MPSSVICLIKIQAYLCGMMDVLTAQKLKQVEIAADHLPFHLGFTKAVFNRWHKTGDNINQTTLI